MEETRYTLRKAIPGDEDAAMSFIDDAKTHLRSCGVDQWQRGYPDRSSIERDMSEGMGYFLTVDGVDAAYLCIDMGGEPAYDRIDGAWLTEGPYGTIHRLAIGSDHRGRGLSKVAFALSEDVIRSLGWVSIRADTNENHAVMRHVLSEMGYVCCGRIWFDYSPKVAYEKVL